MPCIGKMSGKKIPQEKLEIDLKVWKNMDLVIKQKQIVTGLHFLKGEQDKLLLTEG